MDSGSNRSQESLKVGTSSKSVTTEPSRKEQSHEGQAGRVGYTCRKDPRHMPSSQMWALLPVSKAMAEELTLQASSVLPPSLPGQPLTYTPRTLGIQLWNLLDGSRWGHWQTVTTLPRHNSLGVPLLLWPSSLRTQELSVLVTLLLLC